MAINAAWKVLVVSFFYLATPLFADETVNALRDPVPNVIPGPTIDLGKVDKIKDLLSNQIQKPISDILLDDVTKWDDIFASHIKWQDIFNGGGGPLSALCSERCRRCASGCNPICCMVGGTVLTGLRPDDGDGASRPVQRLLPPLACPCHCESNCPSWVQTNCCSTRERVDTAADDTRLRAAPVARHERASQQIALGLNDKKVPWKPETCPCTCESDCPPYVQDICCASKGPGGKKPPGDDDNNAAPGPPPSAPQPAFPPTRPSPSGDVLAIVAESRTGGPLSVWARLNLTIFDSFITMDLVNGLQRAVELTQNDETGATEIVLNIAVGPSDGRKAYAQSFQVVDGSNLAEKEQVLLGLGFLSRIGAVKLKSEFLTGLEEGLPLLTGTTTDEVPVDQRPIFTRERDEL